jgi:hypothetical protein
MTCLFQAAQSVVMVADRHFVKDGRDEPSRSTAMPPQEQGQAGKSHKLDIDVDKPANCRDRVPMADLTLAHELTRSKAKGAKVEVGRQFGQKLNINGDQPPHC